MLTDNSKHNAVNGGKYCEGNGGKKCSKFTCTQDMFRIIKRTKYCILMSFSRDKCYLAWRRRSWNQQKFESLFCYQPLLIQGDQHSHCVAGRHSELALGMELQNNHRMKNYVSVKWCTYTETVEPVPVPNRPSNRVPMPWMYQHRKTLVSTILPLQLNVRHFSCLGRLQQSMKYR